MRSALPRLEALEQYMSELNADRPLIVSEVWPHLVPPLFVLSAPFDRKPNEKRYTKPELLRHMRLAGYGRLIIDDIPTGGSCG